jgi:hypothetical protein
VEKNIGFVVLGAVLLISTCTSVPEKIDGMADEWKKAFIERQLVSLGQVVEAHKEIKDTDRSLEKLRPIAVIENGIYFVFDLDQSGEKYEFIMEHPYTRGDGKGIRTVETMDFYGPNAVATTAEELTSVVVISEEAFESADGRAQIFHEFVHCFQWDEGEWNLKQTLAIAREAWEKRDFMWELNHPFPYTSEFFISKTRELDNGYDIGKYHAEMKAELDEKDFEYMLWQEWKEGYARYIENLVRERWGLDKVSTPSPFERHILYEIGSRYIEALIRNDPKLKGNVEALFYKMVNS